MKKITLSLGALAVAVAPIATVVACGTSADSTNSVASKSIEAIKNWDEYKDIVKAGGYVKFVESKISPSADDAVSSSDSTTVKYSDLLKEADFDQAAFDEALNKSDYVTSLKEGVAGAQNVFDNYESSTAATQGIDELAPYIGVILQNAATTFEEEKASSTDGYDVTIVRSFIETAMKTFRNAGEITPSGVFSAFLDFAKKDASTDISTLEITTPLQSFKFGDKTVEFDPADKLPLSSFSFIDSTYTAKLSVIYTLIASAASYEAQGLEIYESHFYDPSQLTDEVKAAAVANSVELEDVDGETFTYLISGTSTPTTT